MCTNFELLLKVDVMVSRDLDSIVSERESHAVKEWIFSSKSHHFMNDHPRHTSKIMAGLWGAKLTNKYLRFRWVNLFKKVFTGDIFDGNLTEYGLDQIFLEK